jgi:hypothetical protein
MATVHDESYYRRAAFFFFWAKGPSAKDIHKEMFPVYGMTCLSCKTFHNCVEKRGKCFADDKGVETEVWKWLRQQSKTSMLRVSTHW